MATVLDRADDGTTDEITVPPDIPKCPDCGLSLDLSQPDIREPGRLHGVCLDCRSWWECTFEANIPAVVRPF